MIEDDKRKIELLQNALKIQKIKSNNLEILLAVVLLSVGEEVSFPTRLLVETDLSKIDFVVWEEPGIDKIRHIAVKTKTCRM